jgi:hypothetical protein
MDESTKNYEFSFVGLYNKYIDLGSSLEMNDHSKFYF